MFNNVFNKYSLGKNNMRFLEGESYLYRGLIYIVKGYQHPENFLIAYPKYSAISGSKLEAFNALKDTNIIYWDCLKLTVPVIPLDSAHPYTLRGLNNIHYYKSVLEALLDTELYLTGSASYSSQFRDVDFVIYEANDKIVAKLRELFQRKILEKSIWLLIKEHRDKHSSSLNLTDYLYLKKNTILHGYYRGIHVNLKLIELSKGYNTCIEPVYGYSHYTGYVTVKKAENPHLLPTRYNAYIEKGEVVLESLRELYAELRPGLYYTVNSRLEERKNGFYLVPDHGILIPVKE